MRGLLVAGTASDVGKSVVVAGLCRWLARRGIKVAPSDGSGKVEIDYTVNKGPFGANNIVCSPQQRCTLKLSELKGGDDVEQATASIEFAP